jgi:hypothetical protein
MAVTVTTPETVAVTGTFTGIASGIPTVAVTVTGTVAFRRELVSRGQRQVREHLAGFVD